MTLDVTLTHGLRAKVQTRMKSEQYKKTTVYVYVHIYIYIYTYILYLYKRYIPKDKVYIC